jgi:hypothetical protein
MTPQIAVLGIVAERAGTVSDIQRRLSDLFSSADFSHNSAHGALPALARKGHVRLVREGAEEGGDFYESTRAGIERLRGWILSSPRRPAIREAIHGKVEFATLDELAELIVIVRADVKECQLAGDEAHERILAEQRIRIAARGEFKGWQEELDDELSDAHLVDVTLSWDDLVARLRKLADRLEEIHKKYKSKAG